MKSSDMAVEAVLILILLIIGIVTVYPFLNVLALSFNESGDSIKGGITIWPRVFTLLPSQQDTAGAGLSGSKDT